MVENENTGIWEAIKNAFKYTIESAKGKYSLDTYLEVLSEFTDQEINKSIDAGQMYGGGEVTFFAKEDSDDIRATVTMKFYDPEDKKTKDKKAERQLPKKMFTTEAVEKLVNKGVLTYEIEAPRRE